MNPIQTQNVNYQSLPNPAAQSQGAQATQAPVYVAAQPVAPAMPLQAQPYQQPPAAGQQAYAFAPKTTRKLINAETITGVAMIVGGVIATLVSYEHAVSTGADHYLIFWYLPLIGLLFTLQGLGVIPDRRKK